MFSSTLSPSTQNVVNTSQNAVTQLVNEIARPPQERLADIQQQRDRYFKEERSTINRETDNVLAKTRSALSRRFGRSDNSTFGNALIADVEGHRVDAINRARVNADTLAEDRLASDQQARMERLGVFQSLLNNVFDQAQGVSSDQSSTLINEARLENQRALARAQLVQRNSDNSYFSRMSLLSRVANPIASGLGNFISSNLFTPKK